MTFNFSALTGTRVTVEQVFGQLKRRFHCLHDELRVTPEKACAIFIACAIIHNICKDLNIPDVDDDEDIEILDMQEVEDGANDAVGGIALRQYIVDTYFN